MYLEIARAERGEGVQRIPAWKSLQLVGLAWPSYISHVRCNQKQGTPPHCRHLDSRPKVLVFWPCTIEDPAGLWLCGLNVCWKTGTEPLSGIDDMHPRYKPATSS